MKNKLWFKAKEYGWGWYPSSWEGWLVMMIFIVAEIALFVIIDAQHYSTSNAPFIFIPRALVLVTILITICYLKGEKPGWRWGNK